MDIINIDEDCKELLCQEVILETIQVFEFIRLNVLNL